MTEDARFEDGGDRPLRLMAQDAEDLGALSALLQDAVFPGTEMKWRPAQRQFALLVNRYRWEFGGKAPERVQSVLTIEDVKRVASQGIDRRDADTVLSLLSLDWTPAEDGAGRLTLTLAGDGAIALDVECIDVALRDVTRPYVAPSGKTPTHPTT